MEPTAISLEFKTKQEADAYVSQLKSSGAQFPEPKIQDRLDRSINDLVHIRDRLNIGPAWSEIVLAVDACLRAREMAPSLHLKE